jgi:hypothetical protein
MLLLLLLELLELLLLHGRVSSIGLVEQGQKLSQAIGGRPSLQHNSRARDQR